MNFFPGPIKALGGFIHDKLPFSLNPAEFWADAMKTIYGPGHVLLGLGQSNMTYPDGTPMNLGPLFSGLIFTVGGGFSNQGALPSFHVKLHLLDFKIINWDGGVAMEYDTTKPGDDCSLVSLNPQKIFHAFTEFGNPLNWPHLIEEFTNNPIEFFEKHIDVFYPAGININLNLRGTIGGFGQGITGIMGGRNLVNKNPIWICCENVPKFPPANLGLCPRDPIVLVDENNKNKVVAIVQNVETIWIHPAIEAKTELAICQPIVAATLSYDKLRDLINTYLQPSISE